MRTTTGELAAFIDGKLEGDPSLVITGLAGLREAQAGHISFLDQPRYTSLLATTKASAVVVGLQAEVPEGCTVIRVTHPGVAFGKIVTLVTPKAVEFQPGIDARAHVAPTATIDPTASIQPFAVIEAGARVGARTVIGAGSYIGHESTVGKDCFLYPHATIRERCQVGDRVILHPCAVVGSDGFGYEWTNGHYEKIPQIGNVQIDDDVEIGANTTIDRGRFGRTWIQKGVKIDNLVQIAHNVTVGEHTAIAGQAGISGSTLVGKNVRIAGQAGTVGHITIGDGSTIGAKSGVNHDVPKGKYVFGYPAQDHREALKTHANIRRLPYLMERLKKLEELIANMQK